MLFMLAAGAFAPSQARSAPFAAMVMDARTGEVIFARNADTRLHPASLTKMMTLYIAFQAVERGEIGLDTMVTITSAAANEPPSRLGLRSGQQIAFRYLIRAAAIRSANDAAHAIGVAISGSEDAFARRMNATAQAMGMRNTTFVNMHGLTADGHMSTAHDMTILGRHVIYDFPQYYNLFSRRSADAGIAQVLNTNRRFLDAYDGADGIKTGYTNAAGYNLVASAQRGQERIIATVFGGTSVADRNRRAAEFLDMGFSRAPGQVAVNAPQPAPAMDDIPAGAVVLGQSVLNAPPAARTVRVSGLVTRSLRPVARPAGIGPDLDGVSDDMIADALAQALEQADAGDTTGAAAPPGAPDTGGTMTIAEAAAGAEGLDVAGGLDDAVLLAAAPPPEGMPAPETRPREIIMTSAAIAPAEVPLPEAAPEVVTRLSTSGGHHWGINVGRFNSRYDAERHLLTVALNEAAVLSGGLRRVVQRPNGFDANFMGLTREGADLACRRLQARGTTCFMIGTE
nr:D-alanyl-D-alanine carboxypeptidase family protein [Wenxinia marina]